MTAPLRVTLVTPYYPGHRGGVESVAGQIAARVAASGVAEIDWHASDCDPAPGVAPGLRSAPARAWNIAERRLGFPYPLWSPGAVRALARSVRRSDAVHLHECVYLPSLLAFLFARLAGRPVMVTQHISTVPYRNPVLRALHFAANRVLGSLVLGGAAQTVFISSSVQRYFEHFVRFRRPPAYVANGVDATLFHPAGDDERKTLRRSLGLREEEPMLLFVGRFVEKKGLAMLRALAAELREAHWYFAGWGALDPSGWRLPNVSVERSPPRERLVNLYQAADLLVLPSVGEGFPLVVQEAMACGTPALVSRDTAAGAVTAQPLLYTEELDETRWAARIRGLLAVPEALQAKRHEVTRFAREHWSWDKCAERYVELLRSITVRSAAR
ncbi:MAG: hypothetical protein K0R40_603 [Burkholderiales bacterium]|jgi:glycosyltransferase involved in cell wall biosynthesis|nr:hypothetical protein [Burkholderiales bacterium]